MIINSNRLEYKAAYDLVVSELEIAEKQLEELKCKVFALQRAELGLGILVGEYDIEYHEKAKKFSYAKVA